jgi:hypothetical protein
MGGVLRIAALLLMLVPLAGVAADDLTPLSDEFNDAATLSQWKRIYAIEGWGANQLEIQDINTTRPGRMVMVPFTSTWFNDYRGELTFKEVTGNFVVTTDVEATQRNGSGAPRSRYSLGGIMIRTPRSITPATWQPGGENYVFLSLGTADQPGTFQFEVKSTVNSNSGLIPSFAGTPRALIQYARIGAYFIALHAIDGVWTVHHRYFRPDMPATLQVGMTVYTDYPAASSVSPLTHNSSVIRAGTPDLVAAFDYFRFARPQVPPALVNANLNQVSDAELLAFLGANANPAPPANRRHAVKPR